MPTATDVLGPTRQVYYMSVQVVGWERRQSFVDLMRAARVEITSVNQTPTPKVPTGPTSEPPPSDDDWHTGRVSDFRD